MSEIAFLFGVLVIAALIGPMRPRQFTRLQVVGMLAVSFLLAYVVHLFLGII